METIYIIIGIVCLISFVLLGCKKDEEVVTESKKDTDIVDFKNDEAMAYENQKRIDHANKLEEERISKIKQKEKDDYEKLLRNKHIEDLKKYLELNEEIGMEFSDEECYPDSSFKILKEAVKEKLGVDITIEKNKKNYTSSVCDEYYYRTPFSTRRQRYPSINTHFLVIDNYYYVFSIFVDKQRDDDDYTFEITVTEKQGKNKDKTFRYFINKWTYIKGDDHNV